MSRSLVAGLLLLMVFGCGGGGAGGPPQPPGPTIHLEQTSAAPFAFVTLGSVGVPPGLPGTVRLQGDGGFDATVQLYESNPVQFICPPYMNPTTGETGPANLILDLAVGGTTYRGDTLFAVADLPLVGGQLGAETLSALESIYEGGVGTATDDVTSLLANLGGGAGLDQPRIIDAVDEAAEYITAFRDAVQLLVSGSATSVVIGTYSTGSGPMQLKLDADSLSLLDRYLGAFVAGFATAPALPIASVQSQRTSSTPRAAALIGTLGSWTRSFLAENPKYVDLLSGTVAVSAGVLIGAAAGVIAAPALLTYAATAVVMTGVAALWYTDVEFEVSKTAERVLTGSGSVEAAASAFSSLEGAGLDDLDAQIEEMGRSFLPDELHPLVPPLGHAMKRLAGSRLGRLLGLGAYGDAVTSGQIRPYPYANVSGSYVGYYSVNPKPWTINVSVRPDGSGSYSWTSENVSGSANGSVSNENPGWRIHGNSDYQIQCRPDGSSVTFWYILCPGGVNCFVITAYPN